MHHDALDIYRAGLDAIQPAKLVPPFLRRRDHRLLAGDQVFDPREQGSIFLVSAGKAAASMAAAALPVLGEDLAEGLVVCPYGYGLPLEDPRVVCLEAAHPVPDSQGQAAAGRILTCVRRAGPEDLVLVLLSGGASALIADPPPGLDLEGLQEVFRVLLRSGADIREINVVRKHLSFLKGGQLARACWPARIITLVLSDVVGDPLDVIASGPTVPDTSTFADARAVLEKYRLWERIPASARDWLTRGLQGQVPATAGPEEPGFAQTFNYLIGNNRTALEAAARKATRMGYTTRILTDSLQGEASLRGSELARELLAYRGPRPACLLAGGETTVTVRGNGRGGRNQELVAGALREFMASSLSPEKIPVLLSAGTDGADGPTDAAGGWVDGEVIERVRSLDLQPESFLEHNDCYNLLSRAGGLLITGPTRTNVMDLVVGLIPGNLPAGGPPAGS
ncbi:MAG TPA: glycerate kinase [Chitinophagaceae bacterium]|nr:glycerate kinase [Chitinophagaceae bacterium]